MDSASTFYDRISEDYTEYIRRCVPRYDEMHEMILRYVPDDLEPTEILELGTGRGELTDHVLEKYPDATCHLVDFSKDMIESCIIKYDRRDNIRLHLTDFAHLDFPSSSFDLVVSSISIHHLPDPLKERLFGVLFDVLKDGGVLSYSDQFGGSTPEIYEKHMQSWQRASAAKGASDEEWKMWMEHQKQHDYHTSLRNQMRWLEEAGFKTIDCVWRHLLWTVLVAER